MKTRANQEYPFNAKSMLRSINYKHVFIISTENKRKMGICGSKHERILSTAEGVLPTILERYLSSKEHRLKFEESLEDTECNLVLQLFKPLIFFEIGVYTDRNSAGPLGDLYKTVYLIPHKDQLTEGFAGDIFTRFLDVEVAAVEDFSELRRGLDTEITLKFLLPYQKENNIVLVDGFTNVEEANLMTKVGENYEDVFRLASSTADAKPPKVAPRKFRPRNIIPSINFKKLAFGRVNASGSMRLSGDNRVSWLGMNSVSGNLDDRCISFTAANLKNLAPPHPPRRAPPPGLTKNKTLD